MLWRVKEKRGKREILLSKALLVLAVLVVRPLEKSSHPWPASFCWLCSAVSGMWMLDILPQWLAPMTSKTGFFGGSVRVTSALFFLCPNLSFTQNHPFICSFSLMFLSAGSVFRQLRAVVNLLRFSMIFVMNNNNETALIQYLCLRLP